MILKYSIAIIANNDIVIVTDIAFGYLTGA